MAGGFTAGGVEPVGTQNSDGAKTSGGVIRIPESLCPLPHILSMADTLELFSIEADGAQALGSLALQLVVILVSWYARLDQWWARKSCHRFSTGFNSGE